MKTKQDPELKKYLARLEGYVGKKDHMSLLKSAPGNFERSVRGMTAAALKLRPARGKWSIHEQIGHLADVEAAFGWRFRRGIGEPGKPVESFDQDAWADRMQYRSMPLRGLLAAFRGLREANLQLLTQAPRRARQEGHTLHPERGKQSVDQQARILAGHDVNHLIQVRGIRAKFQKKASGQRSRSHSTVRPPVRKARKG